MIKKFFSVICKFILGLCFFPVVLALSFVLLLCCQAGPHIALMCLFALIVFGIFQIVVSWNNNRTFSIGIIVSSLISFFLFFSFWFFFRDYPQYPDKEKTIAKLEQYKSERGNYPKTLSVIGLKVDDEWVSYSYNPKELNFWLCYIYPTPVGTEGSCYDSKLGKWEAR